MYLLLNALKDTYITNKIVNGRRKEESNVGNAGTLDLFKLYDETYLSGTENPVELTRALIKFDLDPVRALTGSIIDIGSDSFKCFIHLKDVYGGQTNPTDFTLTVLPLSKSFDEGYGRSLTLFEDVDTANWITASVGSTIVTWDSPGASAEGLLGSSDIDVITSGSIDGTVIDLIASQSFTSGVEDLYIDVTTIVSATLSSQLPDHGLRISYASAEEGDLETRFVKRFASRHSTKKSLVPTIKVLYDDSLRDNHQNFFFDTTGSLFLRNYERGTPANIVSGSSLTEITGDNSLKVFLYSGSFTGSYTASQYRLGSNYVNGIYFASLAIPSNETNLATEIKNANSASFIERWTSLDESVIYFQRDLVIKSLQTTRTAFNNEESNLVVNITNSKHSYVETEVERFRVFAFDYLGDEHYLAKKLPYENVSNIFENMFYRVRDANTNDILIPFDTTYNSTRVSTDSKGMYFDLYMTSLYPGRVYEIDILLNDKGTQQIFKGVSGRFRIDK